MLLWRFCNIVSDSYDTLVFFFERESKQEGYDQNRGAACLANQVISVDNTETQPLYLNNDFFNLFGVF